MLQDAHIIIERVSKAIESVLTSDGWVDGEKIYTPDHINQIADAMARKVAEPSKYTSQGFHNTSYPESKLRQFLENDPAMVSEIIASLATTGKATIPISGRRAVVVAVDKRSLYLDLESRLASDQLVANSGIRDACGQLWDLVITQLYWNQQAHENYQFTYSQEPNPRSGSTGEKLLKVDRNTLNRFETVYMGSMLSLRAAVELNQLLGDSGEMLMHSSLGHSIPVPTVSNPNELRQWFSSRPSQSVQIPVFSGLLPGSHGFSNGHDLQMITVQYNSDGDCFCGETRWGATYDIHLISMSAEELLAAMDFPKRVTGGAQLYDRQPADSRVINPAYPIKKVDRSPQLAELELQALNFLQAEHRGRESPQFKRKEQYYKELEIWEAARTQHVSVFGESIPFEKPRPLPPSS